MNKWGCLSGLMIIIILILYLAAIGYEESHKIIHEPEVIFTNESPRLTNIIEARLVHKESKGLLAIKEVTSSFTRIYYGKRGSVLEKYKELKPSEAISPSDEVKVHWEGEELAIIEVTRRYEGTGEKYKTDRIKIYIPN